ncbi:hypothetical protein PSI19_19960 [Xenorhabdus khoisanae]|uniref:hypothetical protein n=1 Tax=Xenorhabdus khoisanae TaxID=880157 RepID=UPI0023592DD9|nr:hypothetical protein [Xenorhabdus khoisanae]MDC9616087.1 hypothetical protein [Xenorhabdus khoisanae]
MRYIPHLKRTQFHQQKQQERRKNRAAWQQKWITFNGLQTERGWTPEAIKIFLEKPVPPFLSGAPVDVMSYPRKQVEAVEKTAEFQSWQQHRFELQQKKKAARRKEQNDVKILLPD